MKTANLLVILLSSALGAIAQPPADKPPDLSGVSAENILKTVDHLQQLVKSAEKEIAEVKKANAELTAKTDSLTRELTAEQQAHEAAKVETVKVQGIVDTRTAERDAALVREKAWRHRAKSLMFAVAALAAFLSYRFTKLLPIPWSYAAAAAAGAAVYGALYALL